MGLVVLATITGALCLFATWAKRQALDTEHWVDTSGKLLVDQRIQDALSVYLTDQIYEAADPQEKLAAALPPKLAPVAGPVSGLIRNGIQKAVEKLLASPRIQDLWQDANRSASTALVDIVNDRPVAAGLVGDAVDAGAANLDLGPIRDQITQQLGLELPKLPPGTKQGIASAATSGDDTSVLEILAPNELNSIQTGGKLIKGLSFVALFLTLALYAGAIYLTPAQRRRTLIMCGLSLLTLGILTMAVRRIAGNEVVDALASSDSVRPATLAVWEIGTSLLRDMAIATVIYGIAVIAAGLLAGPSAAAVKLRGWIAPALRDPMAASAGTAILILLLVWWGPTPAFESLVGVLVLGALIAGGVWALRRQTLAEAAA